MFLNKIGYINNKKLKLDEVNLILHLNKICPKVLKNLKSILRFLEKIKTALSHP